MILKNYELSKAVEILSAEDSIMNNIKIKLPHAFRHALRVNFKAIKDRNDIYKDEIQQIITRYVDEGLATVKEDGKVEFGADHIEEVNTELTELAVVDNDIAFEAVPGDMIERILETVDMSIPEENVIRLFEEVTNDNNSIN